jgi:hypothetical protein
MSKPRRCHACQKPGIVLCSGGLVCRRALCDDHAPRCTQHTQMEMFPLRQLDRRSEARWPWWVES